MNQPQGAVHVMLECNETEAARRQVAAEMDMVVEREGTAEEKGTWKQIQRTQKLELLSEYNGPASRTHRS